MSTFGDLYQKLENSANANDRIEALVTYFQTVSERDKVWAVYLLAGNKVESVISKPKLVGCLTKISIFPDWLLAESAKAVGDQLETLSLLLPSGSRNLLLEEFINVFNDFGSFNQEELESQISSLWKELSQTDRFILGKLITGAKLLALPVEIISRAISEYLSRPLADIKHEFDPQTISFADLVTDNAIAHEHNITVVLMSIIKTGKGLPELGMGVWAGNRLVPIGKVEADLERDELQLIDAWLKDNTIEKYGMAYMVKPELVFEITFANVVESTRHKAGLKLQYPKLVVWNKDKAANEADNLEILKQLLSSN